MYDDLLGKRKRKEDNPPIVLDVGKCGQCEFIKESKIHKRSVHVYCTIIKKYVSRQEVGCLKFKRKKVPGLRCNLIKSK